ncbi:MAG TPA: hypothetical protein VHU19_18180 [Pyrinomonadaceae bacterium]|jgi:hypothetical protein|nr:hypothetical protein [Pyrinomonadaceae bacterium]
MEDNKRIVYSLNVADIQNVASEEFGRILTADEVEIVEKNLGDYIKWYDIIEMVINNHIGPRQLLS